jgi:hypothetical protein
MEPKYSGLKITASSAGKDASIVKSYKIREKAHSEEEEEKDEEEDDDDVDDEYDDNDDETCPIRKGDGRVNSLHG